MPLFPVFSFRLLQSELFNVEKLLFIAMFGRNCRAYDLPSALRSPGSKIAGSDRMFRERPLWGFPMRWPKGKHFTREEFVSMSAHLGERHRLAV